ncbi:histidinol-phosphate transaminase [bacterium]|nr:histidinol-phosphate transaminase [bacterium]
MENYFKRAVLDLQGYSAPPQQRMRAKLNQNESPFDLPQEFKKRVLTAASALPWNRYPMNESSDLKQAIAAWHGLSPDQVLLGNGSNQLLQTVLSATVAENDGVLIFPPTFGLYEIFSILYGGNVLALPHAPSEPFPMEKALRLMRNEQPRIILLCSPNNPTGALLSLLQVQTLCEEACGLVFLDEAYAEFSGQTAIPLLDKYPQLIISRTFSKAFSLAGLRLGYLLASAECIYQLRKANLPYNVNLLTEIIATQLLADRGTMLRQVSGLVKERDWLLSEMQRIPSIRPLPSAANFILFHCPHAELVFDRLKDQGILVRNVGGYPLLKDHLRVSIGRREENHWFLEALKASLS